MKRTLWLLVWIILALSYQSASAATKIYMRGDMNNWEANPAWELTNTSGNNYQIEHVYIRTRQEFKIADADYSTYNCGKSASGSYSLSVGTSYTLSSSKYNVSFSSPLIDATITFNTSTKKLVVTYNDTANPYEEQYLRGGLPDASDWSAIDKYKFKTTDGDYYVLGPISIPEGTEFKIADRRWNTRMTHGSVGDDENQVIDYGYAPNTIGSGSSGANLKIARGLSNVYVVFKRSENRLYIHERIDVGLYNHTTNEFIVKWAFAEWGNTSKGSFQIDTPLEEAQEVSLRVIKYEYNNEDGTEVVSESVDYGPESSPCIYYGYDDIKPVINQTNNDHTITLPKTFSGEVSFAIDGADISEPIPSTITLSGGKTVVKDLYLQGTFDDTPNQELLDKDKFTTEDGENYTYGPITLPKGLNFAISDGSKWAVYASNSALCLGENNWSINSDIPARTNVDSELMYDVTLKFNTTSNVLTVISPYTYGLYDVEHDALLVPAQKIDSSLTFKYAIFGQAEPLNLCIKRMSEYATDNDRCYGPGSDMGEIALPGSDSEDYFTAGLSCNENTFKLLPPEGDAKLVVNVELTEAKPTAVSMKYDTPFPRVYLTRSSDNYQCLPEWEMKTSDGETYILENIYKSGNYGSYYRIQDPSGSDINYGYSSSKLSLSSSENSTSASLTANGNNFYIYGALNNATFTFCLNEDASLLTILNNQPDEAPDLYLCGALENAPNNECIDQYRMTKGSEYYTYGPTLLPNDFSFRISDYDHSNDYTFGLPASAEDCLVDLFNYGTLQLSKGESTKRLILPNYDDKVYLLLKHDKENRKWQLSAQTEHGIYVYDAKRDYYDSFDEYSLNPLTKQLACTLNYDNVSYETNWQIEYDQFSYPTPGEATLEYQCLGLYGLADDYVITGTEENLQLNLVENGPGALIVSKTYSGSVSFIVNYETEFKPTSLLVSAAGDLYHSSIYFIDQSETPEEHILAKSWTCPLESFDQCAVVEMTPTEQYTYLNGKVCPVWKAIFTGIPDKLIISSENFKLDETAFVDKGFYTNEGYVSANFELLSQKEWQSRVDSWNTNCISLHWNEENAAVSSPLCHLVSSDENLEDVIQSIATYDATTIANDGMNNLSFDPNGLDQLYYQAIPSAEDKTYTDVVFYFYDSNNELVNYYVASYADGFDAEHFNKYIYNTADEHRAPQTYLSYTDLDGLIGQDTTELFVIGKGDADDASITLTRTDGSEEKLTYDPTQACKVDVDDDEFFFDLTPNFGSANTARIKMSRVDVAKYRAKVDKANALRDMATFNLRNVGIKTINSAYWSWLGVDYKILYTQSCTLPMVYDNAVFNMSPENDYDLVLEHYIPNTDGSIAEDATAYFIDGQKYSMIVDLHSDCQSIAMTSFDRVPTVTGYLNYVIPDLISDEDADFLSSVRFNGEADNGAVIKRHVNEAYGYISDIDWNNGNLYYQGVIFCSSGEIRRGENNCVLTKIGSYRYPLSLTCNEDGSLGVYAKCCYYYSYLSTNYRTRKFFIELPLNKDTDEADVSATSTMNISMPAPESVKLAGEFVKEGKEDPNNDSSRDIYGVYVTGMDIHFDTDLNSYTDYEFHIGDASQPLRAELITADSEIYQSNPDFTTCGDWTNIENCENWSRYLRGDHHAYPATVFIHDVARVAPGKQLQDTEIAGTISTVYPFCYQSFDPILKMPRKSEEMSNDDIESSDTNSADDSDPFVNGYEYDHSGESMDFYGYTGITYAYRSTPVSFTVIAPVSADVQLPLADADGDANAPVEYYTISGIRVYGQPQPGIYIQRQGNTARKVVIR
jgi:hypothetical protein